MAVTQRPKMTDNQKSVVRMFAGTVCKKWVDSDDFVKDEKDDTYNLCCVELDYCAFYWQTWFWGVCGGVILLLIIASIVGSFFCCCRRRGGGGMEKKNSDEDASEPSDSDKSTMNNPA